MIPLSTSRQDLEAARDYFIPFIKMWKGTNLNNLSNTSSQSAEYLFAIAVNCLIDEAVLLMQKKVLSSSDKIKLKFSDAQAVVFYRMLIVLPVPAEQFYLNKLRNDWILQLDKLLIDKNIYQQPVNKLAQITSYDSFDFEDC
jgi:hypothetical protein